MNRLKQHLCAAVVASLGGGKVVPPEAGRDLWNAFQRLSRSRTYSMQGPNPIQPSEILAWCRLMRQPLGPRHVETILAMDEAWLGRAYASSKAPEGVKTLPPVSKHPISAALLDAVMG